MLILFNHTSTKLKEFKAKTKREQWHALFSNLWVTPLFYLLFAIMLFALAAFLDLGMDLGKYVPQILSIEYQLTQTILSTLTAGILSLTTFTFYGVLAALTTFSVQFSPRILKNFMLNTVTQRTLGVFIGSFHYVLLCLLFVNKEAGYFFIPVTGILLAVLSILTFIFFINHIVTWLQVANMTNDMKEEASMVAENVLLNNMDDYRVKDIERMEAFVPEDEKRSKRIEVYQSGYVQKVNFVAMIQEAEKDGIIIQLEKKVGDYVFESTTLLRYWKYSEGEVDEEKYQSLVAIGKNQNEMQDIEFSLNKLVEIALRAIGSNDPKTASRTIYQIGDLLIKISRLSAFTPYLADDQGNLRVILKNLAFKDYLYVGLASIRHYARKNVILTIEILEVLYAIAEVRRNYNCDSIWEFAVYTIRSLELDYIHSLEREKLYHSLYKIAKITRNEAGYDKQVGRMLNDIEDEEDRQDVIQCIPINSDAAFHSRVRSDGTRR